MIKKFGRYAGPAACLFSTAFLGTGCSAVLDWNPQGLQCDAQQGCSLGFSCLVNQCIRDGSLNRGSTCNEDKQCEGDMVCPQGIFTCRDICPERSVFESTSVCSVGEYCAPVPDGAGGTIAVCAPGDSCTLDGDCGPGNICVQITSSAFACLPGCEIDWNAGYSDNCDSSPTDLQYCQPLGQSPERLLCLEAGSGAAGEGAPCGEGLPPGCLPGLACFGGLCSRHCDPNGGGLQCGAGAPLCCTQPDANPVYGVCRASCG